MPCGGKDGVPGGGEIVTPVGGRFVTPPATTGGCGGAPGGVRPPCGRVPDEGGGLVTLADGATVTAGPTTSTAGRGGVADGKGTCTDAPGLMTVMPEGPASTDVGVFFRFPTRSRMSTPPKSAAAIAMTATRAPLDPVRICGEDAVNGAAVPLGPRCAGKPDCAECRAPSVG